MRSVIADTGSLYAAYDPSDRYHTQALAEVERLTQQNLTVLLPYPETHSLILKRLGILYSGNFCWNRTTATQRYRYCSVACIFS